MHVTGLLFIVLILTLSLSFQHQVKPSDRHINSTLPRGTRKTSLIWAIFNADVGGENGDRVKKNKCTWLKGFKKQYRQCRSRRGFEHVLIKARNLAVYECQKQFKYDRWNCSFVPTASTNIFDHIYRETAYLQALYTAALTHTVAKACADNKLQRCSCGYAYLKSNYRNPDPLKGQNSSGIHYPQSPLIPVDNRKEVNLRPINRGICSDNIPKAVKIVWNFLRSKVKAGADANIGSDMENSRNAVRLSKANSNKTKVVDVLNFDMMLGLRLLQEFEKMHCTNYENVCIKRLQPFDMVATQLKFFYHNAERATGPLPQTPQTMLAVAKGKNKRHHYTYKNGHSNNAINLHRKQHQSRSTINSIMTSSNSKDGSRDSSRRLLYLRHSPNFCSDTAGRECHDAGNCATVCCGRGSYSRVVSVMVRCNERMIGCCEVTYEICKKYVTTNICL